MQTINLHKGLAHGGAGTSQRTRTSSSRRKRGSFSSCSNSKSESSRSLKEREFLIEDHCRERRVTLELLGCTVSNWCSIQEVYTTIFVMFFCDLNLTWRPLLWPIPFTRVKYLACWADIAVLVRREYSRKRALRKVSSYVKMWVSWPSLVCFVVNKSARTHP